MYLEDDNHYVTYNHVAGKVLLQWEFFACWLSMVAGAESPCSEIISIDTRTDNM